MKINQQIIDVNCAEPEVYNRLLSLDNKNILELGCGAAVMTRDIATSGKNRIITALEVDEIAHAKNLLVSDLDNVTFLLAGAQKIPLDDQSIDIVFMFKSLHHVPITLMQDSMHEIRRVLKPGGLLYISEPVFAGDFNDILRMFHDEQDVREAAFHSIKTAVEQGLFELVEETFFNSAMTFENFAEFENNTIRATHSHHELDEDLHKLVKLRFEQHMTDDGAHFSIPIRVDLLKRPL